MTLIARILSIFLLLSLTGLALNGLVALAERRLLRHWHASQSGGSS